MISLDSLVIVVGDAAPPVERFAATELQRYLHMLFDRECPIVAAPPPGEPCVLIGSPDTNPAIAQLDLLARWPSTDEQTIVVRSVTQQDTHIWLVGGGSPATTLWAVYALVERLGVRYLLSGDVFPEPLEQLALPEIDEVLVPVMRDRVWRMVNDEPHGPEMWSLVEYRRVIDQLAKLRINAIFLSTYPSHPFVHYEFRGQPKTTAVLDYGLRYPITPDWIGREHFGDATTFTNPEFRDCRTYDDWRAAGERFAHAIFDHAHSRGMRVGIAFSLTDVPQEFKARFGDWSPPMDSDEGEAGQTDFTHLGVVTVGTPPKDRRFQNVDNPVLLALSELLVTTHLETYPELDFLIVYSAEFRNAATGYERCWRHLDEKYDLEAVAPLAQLLESARGRYYYAEGRAERELKADIEFLYFIDKLFAEGQLLERLGRTNLPIMLWQLTEELHAVIGRILPRSFAFGTIVDYNLSAALPRIDTLASLEGAGRDTYFTMSVQDDMQSLLISSEGERIQRFMAAMERHGFTGWTSRYWSIGDLDHSVLYLARASWESGLTASAAYDDYIVALCGAACLPEMREALRLLEDLTAVQDTDLFSVGFPYPGLMQRHFEMARYFKGKVPPRAQLLECRDTYLRVRELVRLAKAKARAEAHGRLDYLIGRCTTCALFMETAYTVELAGAAARAAETARAVHDPFALGQHMDDTAALLTKAGALARRATETHAAIMRDESDLGLLAAMNQYMNRYLAARAFLATHEASVWHL